MRQYAKHRGVSAQAVSLAVKAGRIPISKDGKIDVKKADAAWQENTNAQAGSVLKAGPAAMPSYSEARAVRETYAAKLEQLEYQRASGELLPRLEVVAVVTAIHTVVKAGLLSLPATMAPLVAAETDARRVEQLLMTKIRELLVDFSDERNYKVAGHSVLSAA